RAMGRRCRGGPAPRANGGEPDRSPQRKGRAMGRRWRGTTDPSATDQGIRRGTMLTVLLKKQWMEMTASLRRSSVTGRVRTGWKAAAFLVLAACVVLLVMGSVGALAALICQPLSDAGLDWLYFALMGAGALLAGVMGGGFTAYGILYCARDNEQ